MQKTDLIVGTTVRSADGDKLGKVVSVDDTGFMIEKGIFFPKEYRADFSQISDINEDIYLKWGTHLVEQQYDQVYGSGQYANDTSDTNQWSDYGVGMPDRLSLVNNNPTSNETSGLGYQSPSVDRTSDIDKDVNISVREEELEAHKRGMREVGRVRVHKTVRVEDKHFTVPVRREEVRIERVDASSAGFTASSVDDTEAFKEQDITIPIREEEIEISKRPVLKEEVRIKKESHEVERPVVGQVRKEDVQVDEGLGLRTDGSQSDESLTEKLKDKASDLKRKIG